MEFARPPSELSSEGPMNVNWRNWKLQFLTFLKVTGLTDDEPEVDKFALLLNLIGPVGQQDFQKFSFESPNDNVNIDVILEKFDDLYDPKKSEAHERNIFLTFKKKPKQSIDHYVNELRIRAKPCNFGDLTDSFIRDKIILEIKDWVLKKHLLNKPDLNLSQTILLWETHEQETKEVKHDVKQRYNVKKSLGNDIKGTGSGDGAKEFNKNPGCCYKCGTSHAYKNCPAWGTKCEKCGILGHFMKCCKSQQTAMNNVNNNLHNNMATGMNAQQAYGGNAGPSKQIPNAQQAYAGNAGPSKQIQNAQQAYGGNAGPSKQIPNAQQAYGSNRPYSNASAKVMNEKVAFKMEKKKNKSKDDSPDCCIA